MAAVSASGPECEPHRIQILITMASRNDFLWPPGTSPIVAPHRDTIAEVSAIAATKVDVQTRHTAYPGLDSVLDADGNRVGHEVHKVLRYFMRYCLSDAPARVCDQQTLESEMMQLVEKFGFCRDEKKFFTWILACKVGVRTLIGTLYRGFTTAMDVGLVALNKSLLSPRVDDFGLFFGDGSCFNLCKDIFFDAIGFSEEVYADLDRFSKIKLVVNGQLMYGLFAGMHICLFFCLNIVC